MISRERVQTYGDVFEEESSSYSAYLCGFFEPLAAEYTIDLPVSLAVKLTGDEKPAKEIFKFEIYDLGCADSEFEIVNDSVTAENIEFDENDALDVGISVKEIVDSEISEEYANGFRPCMAGSFWNA